MQWHQLDHMQTICTSLHTNTSSLNFYRPDALPDVKTTVSKHWRQDNTQITEKSLEFSVSCYTISKPCHLHSSTVSEYLLWVYKNVDVAETDLLPYPVMPVADWSSGLSAVSESTDWDGLSVNTDAMSRQPFALAACIWTNSQQHHCAALQQQYSIDHGSELDTELWWTRSWKCSTRASLHVQNHTHILL